MRKCTVCGCLNNKNSNLDKHFFCSPSQGEKRELWLKAVNKSFKGTTKFFVCEDHFDLTTDVDYYKINGIPMLKKLAYPHRNLTDSDMKLQEKIDKFNWSCFVPKCKSKRLMTDKKLIFFPVPEDEQGMLWKSAVKTSSVDEPVFCCERHFDVNKDIHKIFHCDGSVEYKVKAGIVPSVIPNDSKQSLGDSWSHPKVIRNNHLAYNSKLLLLIEKSNSYVDIVNDITNELEDLAHLSNMIVENGLDDEPYIKTELIDFGYDDKSNSRFIIERQEFYCDPGGESELLIEKQEVYSEPESGTESESSVDDNKAHVKDPDVNFEDFSSDTDDTISSSDCSDIIETSENDEDSDVDTTERFECPHCKKLVRKLEEHVERTHGNSAKKINRTICGLCSKQFPYKGNLKDHQKEVHNGNAYACDLCDFMTSRYQIIKKHILQIHLHEKYYLCHICGKSYTFMKDLKKHTKNHSEKRDRKHTGHMCDKKYFHYAQSLRAHINAFHLKERKFHCEFNGCNKSFLRKGSLFQHQQVHKRTLFPCIICEKKFTFKCNLLTHVKNIHRTT